MAESGPQPYEHHVNALLPRSARLETIERDMDVLQEHMAAALSQLTKLLATAANSNVASMSVS